MADTEPIRQLWNLLVSAHARTYRRTAADRTADRAVTVAYRNGLFDAYVLITGRDGEEVYDALQDAVIADHERSIAAQG